MGLGQPEADDVHDENAQQCKAPHDIQLVDARGYRHVLVHAVIGVSRIVPYPEIIVKSTPIWRFLSQISP